MKKVFLVLLGITALLLTGCAMKTDVEITVDQNHDVSIDYIIAMDDEMIDTFLSLQESSDDEETEAETTEEKVYTDEQRWAYIEEDVAKSNENFEYVGRYDKDGLKGCILNSKEGNIDNVSVSSLEEITSLDSSLSDGKFFVKKGNEYTMHFDYSEDGDSSNDGLDVDSIAENGGDVSQNLILHLPCKAKSHNATSVSDDGLTYTWDLQAVKVVDIVFELEEVKEEEKANEETSTETIWENASVWAIEGLNKANELGLIPEILAKTNLTENITRKEFAHVAVELYEKITGETVVAGPKNPFTDTEDQGVLKAYNLEITNGTSETTFSPDSLITREQMATMLTRALKKAKIDTTVDLEKATKFADDDKMSDWSRESIYFMSGLEIIKGMGDNTFGTLGNATREQALLISERSALKFAK